MGIPETVWLAIVGVFAMLIKEYFDRLRYTHADDNIKNVMTKVESAVEHVGAVNAEVVEVKQNLKAVEAATNGLGKSLSDAKSETAFLEGEKAGIQHEKNRQANGIVEVNRQANQ